MRDLLDTIDLMTNEEAGQIFKSIINHVDGNQTELNRELIFAFTPIRNQLDRDMEKYDSFVEKQRKNGALGGRPKKNPKNPCLLKKTQKTQANPNNLVTDTDTVNATENDTVNVNEKKRFTPPTLEQIKTYISEQNYPVDSQKFFDHYETANWYRGKTKIKNWKACVRTWLNGNSGKAAYGADSI